MEVDKNIPETPAKNTAPTENPPKQAAPEASVVKIPVVQYKGFQFPMRVLKEEDWVKATNGEITPEGVVRELRAHVVALEDKITILLAAITLSPGDDVKEFLKGIGLTIMDVNQKAFPSGEPVDISKMNPPTPN